ncbi:Hpt domain-containing protein [Pseudarthrobacter sp. NPDC092184]|uniref:Hpt domain-containing protein n=1 Tax=unclassified Pseudarthrobacter TaxID=2647000 RepID=UPI003811A0E9
MSHHQTRQDERGTPLQGAVAAGAADAAWPLVDRSVLDRLGRELDDDGEGYTKIFVANFIACLPGRIERLRLALTTGDLEAAVDAVLSLKTSSQMVGAERLAALATDLETEVRGGASRSDTMTMPKLAGTFLGPIDRCGSQTVHILDQWTRAGSVDRTR